MASFSSSTDDVPIPIAMEVQAMSLSTSELEVIQWLQSIGFERYQQNFVAADIFSFAVVRQIESSDDLQELGIPKFSAKALMEHIVELKTKRVHGSRDEEEKKERSRKAAGRGGRRE